MIGAVTDDFTGTASAGVLIAKSQVKTGLFFDAEAVENFRNVDRLEAIFVSSNSRHLSPTDAYTKVYKTTDVLKKIGVNYFSKKIDTTLRGGIGYEIDAMLDYFGDDMVAIVVTAMPQSRRICVGGFSIIDGVILTETSVAWDVKTPVKECYVPSLLRGQTKRKVDLININNVINGKESLMTAMKESLNKDNKILVIDSLTLEHIDVIAQACVELNWNILAVDPGAFTMKLNYHRGLVKEEMSRTPEIVYENNGKVALFVVGSTNPRTKTQIERLCIADPSNVLIQVSPFALIDGKEVFEKEVNKVVADALHFFQKEVKPDVIIIETALNGSVVDLKNEDIRHNYDSGTCSKLINEGLAEITDRIMNEVGQESIAGLLLTGGDTMESVCRKLQVSCIQAIDNIVAQVDVGKIMGKYDGLPIIVKGGFCGYEDIGVDIVKRLFIESAK